VSDKEILACNVRQLAVSGGDLHTKHTLVLSVTEVDRLLCMIDE